MINKIRKKIQSFCPGLHSYRGRYIGLSVSISITLILIAIIGGERVNQLENEIRGDIANRSIARTALNEVQNELNLVKNHLYLYLLSPSEVNSKRLNQSVEKSQSLLNTLEQTLEKNSYLEKSNRLDSISSNLNALKPFVQKVIQMRESGTEWLPGMQIASSKLQPSNLKIADAATGLVTLFENFSNEKEQALYVAAVKFRHHWGQIIGEFRLFLANRFSVFETSSMEAMIVRLNNINLYHSEAEKHLIMIKQLVKDTDYEFEGMLFVETIEEQFYFWFESLNEFYSFISKEEWRADLQYLHNEIFPSLNYVFQDLSALKKDMDIQSAKELGRVTSMAQGLSQTMIYIAVFSVLTLVIGYITFSRWMIRPIIQATHALRLQAEGGVVTEDIDANVSETVDLVQAFNEMRSQVNAREEKLDHMAHHDALTGLPNRVLFRDRLEHALEQVKRSNIQLAVMFLDLDRFKPINDSLGHDVGDILLCEVSYALKKAVRSLDTVARLGGDEFAILLESISNSSDIEHIANKILNIINQPFIIQGNELHIGTSIGISVAPTDSVSGDHLLRDADAAMYEAKKAGRGTYRFFSAEIGNLVSKRVELENALRIALSERQFEFFYQAIKKIGDDSYNGYEALLRWRHPSEGIISPAAFLHVLEDSGLIASVTHQLLTEITNLLKEASNKIDTISVNLSGKLIRDSEFMTSLVNRIEHLDPPPEHLCLEITEDCLAEHITGVSSVLNRLRELGVKIALDDFGTGQSSLNHLRSFDFDIIKIDRSFVRDVISDPRDANLVKAIIRLSHALGLKVIAEGVENIEQFDYVKYEGSDYIQGYFYSKPLPGNEVFKMSTPQAASTKSTYLGIDH